MCACVSQPTPRMADVTVTKIAGYVRVRILMNRWFFRIFGIHSFYATTTLLNIWICLQWTCSWRWLWGQIGLCILSRRSRSKAVANDYGTWVWTLNPSVYNEALWSMTSQTYEAVSYVAGLVSRTQLALVAKIFAPEPIVTATGRSPRTHLRLPQRISLSPCNQQQTSIYVYKVSYSWRYE